MKANRCKSAALTVAIVHFVAVVAIACYVELSTDGEAALIWVRWSYIDYPISLAYGLVGAQYADWVLSFMPAHPVLAQLLYFPNLLHGIVGTMWWYVVVSVFCRL